MLKTKHEHTDVKFKRNGLLNNSSAGLTTSTCNSIQFMYNLHTVTHVSPAHRRRQSHARFTTLTSITDGCLYGTGDGPGRAWCVESSGAGLAQYPSVLGLLGGSGVVLEWALGAGPGAPGPGAPGAGPGAPGPVDFSAGLGEMCVPSK